MRDYVKQSFLAHWELAWGCLKSLSVVAPPPYLVVEQPQKHFLYGRLSQKKTFATALRRFPETLFFYSGADDGFIIKKGIRSTVEVEGKY